MRFSDKVFLVTGAGRGIGRAIAQRLVDDGARVAVVERDARSGREAAELLGERARAFRADVAREADVRRVVAAAVKWGGRLDGVVNNAGLADPEIGPVERVTFATWRRFLDVNLGGAFLCAKHAVPALRKTRGAIVNIASTRAIMSEPETAAYAASKGGLVALTHALAIELGPEVRVNAISPGWIDTGGARLSKRDHAQHPVGRVGRVEDVAALAAWLLSDEAGFVTGANYVQDGGMTRKMVYR